MTEAYVELHAASAFSLLQAASQPESLIERAAELNMPAIALLDHNGVYGAARFHTSAKRSSVRAHVGAEISVGSFGPRLTPPAWLPHKHPKEPARLPLLCASREGYQNLCQLITQFKMRETKKSEGAANFDDLGQYASGLVCLTGGDEGPLAAALVRGGEAAARETVEQMTRIFGRKNVYVELQRHREREEEWRNQAAIRIAHSLNLPLIATNGVRYADEYDREIQDLFTAIRHHVELDQGGRLLALNNLRCLRGYREMATLFRDVPGAVENTVALSSRLGFELDDLGYEFPRYPVPEGESMDSFLQKRVAEGIERRYGPKNDRNLIERAKKQVEHELKLIAKLGFAGYFLIVWDIIRFCKQNDILVQGRGSAANSAVCYCLEITAIDPVGMELLFERFLSESRNEWPDIDLDLPSEEKREQAIQYVYRRYGELGAAMTANVITYRSKSAARETGKALGFDADTLGRLSGLVGQWEWRGKTDTMAHSFEHAGFDIHHPRIAKYLELSMRILDLPRHLGQHSGGMVICQGQLNQVVPLERASMPGRTVIQWDKEDCADMGIIKVDLLGLGMMAVLHDCLELIPAHYGEKVDLAQLPQDDEVYAKSLTRQSAETLVASRRQDGPFLSADDLTWRVPALNRRELTRLAQIGAMNQLNGIQHRRDALWQVERAGKLEGPLFRQNTEALHEDSDALPLQKMGIEERLVADYAGTGLTVGKHPMHYRRAELRRNNILSAEELRTRKDGEFVCTAGCVIARQRPGTAKGFIFISMEDETGIANVIVTPDLYERDRLVVTRSKFLLVEGPLQNQDNVIHVKATRLSVLSDRSLEVRSHDFH